MHEVLRTVLGSLHCHVWETYYDPFPLLDISLMLLAMNKGDDFTAIVGFLLLVENSCDWFPDPR
jgi:hypothetical protein